MLIYKSNSIKLKRPKDVGRLSQRVIDAILRTGDEVKHAGKLCNLGILWLKAYEVSKLEDIEARLAALEADRNGKR